MLIGHEQPWASWRRARSNERMHHAWLLTGKSGVGKARFAQAAARELVGAEPTADHHPDILTLTYGPKDDKEERKRQDGKAFERARSIRIGQIRTLQQRLTTRPTLGTKRAVIIDPADDLERNAANALLKSLEEPPAGTVFLLVSHSPARLLPTIRSRCRMLRFPVLADSDLDMLISRHAPGAGLEERRAAIKAAAGSPGAALAFVDMGLGKVAKIMRSLRDEGDPTFAKRGELAAQIGPRPDRDRLRAILDLSRATLIESAESRGATSARASIDAHAGLVRLTGEFVTYNYDPGLLAIGIGNLLASAAGASERANG